MRSARRHVVSAPTRRPASRGLLYPGIAGNLPQMRRRERGQLGNVCRCFPGAQCREHGGEVLVSCPVARLVGSRVAAAGLPDGLKFFVHAHNSNANRLRLTSERASVSDMRKTETQESTAKCLRCGHRIRAASSIAAKYGPVCRARIRLAAINEAVKGFAAAQVEKARELISDGGLIPTGRPGIFRAVSSKGTDRYLVHSAVCNCPAGLHGRLCYHVAGARILVAAGKAV